MGNFIDPAKAGMIPLTEDIYIMQKKTRKESLPTKLQESSSHLTEDMSAISESAMQEAENAKVEDFKQSAIENLSQLDSSSETFLEEATDRIIESALKREFGKGLTNNKGFEQMKNTIMRQLLENNEHRLGIEKFIEELMPAVHNFVYSSKPETQAEASSKGDNIE